MKYFILLLLFISSLYSDNINWERYYEVSPKWEAVIKQCASEFDLPVIWIKGIITKESNWDMDAVDGTGTCFGSMQSKSGKRNNSVIDNIHAGCRKLRESLEYFNYDLYWTFNGYNLGNPKAKKYKNAGLKWNYASEIFRIMHIIETIDLELKIRYKFYNNNYGEETIYDYQQ